MEDELKVVGMVMSLVSEGYWWTCWEKGGLSGGGGKLGRYKE